MEIYRGPEEALAKRHDLMMHEVLKEAITMEKAEQVEAAPAPVPVLAPVREEGMEKWLNSIETALQSLAETSAVAMEQISLQTTEHGSPKGIFLDERMSAGLRCWTCG